MSEEWKVEAVPALHGYAVEWLEPGRAFLSRKNRIYRATTPTGKRELVGTVTAPSWQRLVSGTRLGQRLLRFMAYNVVPFPDGTIFVTFAKQVGVFSGGSYRTLHGMSRPCRVLRRGCAPAPDGSVYWGEYISNENRGSITIYRYRPGTERAEVVHAFEPGEVRHVHGIYTDPYTNALWCVVGDRPHECRILRTHDGFKTLETIGQGDETWRTVSLLFTRDAVYYASDAEFRANQIYRLDRRTGKRETLGEVDGPVFYSLAMGEDLFFASTAELCPSQEKPQATLWHVVPSGEVKPVFSRRKDLFRLHAMTVLFMMGTLHFPAGPGLDGETYISGVGLQGLDNRTVRLRRGRDG